MGKDREAVVGNDRVEETRHPTIARAQYSKPANNKLENSIIEKNVLGGNLAPSFSHEKGKASMAKKGLNTILTTHNLQEGKVVDSTPLRDETALGLGNSILV